MNDFQALTTDLKLSSRPGIGQCPALGGGTLTMNSDGTLFREHKTPDFTASGPLTRK